MCQCEVGSTFAIVEGRGRPHTTHGDGAGALGGLFTAFVLYVLGLAKREPWELQRPAEPTLLALLALGYARSLRTNPDLNATTRASYLGETVNIYRNLGESLNTSPSLLCLPGYERGESHRAVPLPVYEEDRIFVIGFNRSGAPGLVVRKCEDRQASPSKRKEHTPAVA